MPIFFPKLVFCFRNVQVGIVVSSHHHIVNLADVFDRLGPLSILPSELVAISAVEVVFAIQVQIELAVTVPHSSLVIEWFFPILGNGFGVVPVSSRRETQLKMCLFEVLHLILVDRVCLHFFMVKVSLIFRTVPIEVSAKADIGGVGFLGDVVVGDWLLHVGCVALSLKIGGIVPKNHVGLPDQLGVFGFCPARLFGIVDLIVSCSKVSQRIAETDMGFFLVYWLSWTLMA